jgi:hypothetical protein
MSRVPLSLACWDYDRTRALADGSVRPEGLDLTYLNLPVEETFFRMLRHHEFDAAEMSLSSYVTAVGAAGADAAPLVGIPVFPSRAFRHNGIYVHAGSGIDKPSDLVGRTIGVPEYQQAPTRSRACDCSWPRWAARSAACADVASAYSVAWRLPTRGNSRPHARRRLHR